MFIPNHKPIMVKYQVNNDPLSLTLKTVEVTYYTGRHNLDQSKLGSPSVIFLTVRYNQKEFCGNNTTSYHRLNAHYRLVSVRSYI